MYYAFLVRVRFKVRVFFCICLTARVVVRVMVKAIGYVYNIGWGLQICL